MIKKYKIIFVCRTIKDVVNSSSYQRALMLSNNFNTICICCNPPPVACRGSFHRVFIFKNKWLFITISLLLAGFYRIKYSYEIIYTQYNSDILCVGFLTKFFFRYKWIYDLWDHPSLEYELKNGLKSNIKCFLWKNLISFMLTKADIWVMGLHKGILQHLPRPKKEIHLIYITKGTDKFCNSITSKSVHKATLCSYSKTLRSLNIASIGWATKERGIELTILILKSLEENNISAKVTVAGFTNIESLTLIQKHNARSTNKINYIGRVDFHEIEEIYANSDIGLCILDQNITNYRYAYPIKLFEYMSYGLVPITTKTYATSQIIQNGHNGFLVENSEKSLCDVLMLLYDNPQTVKCIINHAKITASKYRWVDINKYLADKIYEKLSIR